MNDDRMLVERAQQGDRSSFGELVKRHQRKVYATALQMTGSHGEADDLAQETFLRAFQAIDRFDGRSEFSTWIYRIVVNLSINHLKRRARANAADETDPRVLGALTSGSGDPATEADRRRFYVRLATALDALPEALKATVVLVSFQGMPHRVVGEILGCSEGTVSWRVHQARKLLRESLGDELGEAGRAGGGGR